MKLVIFLHKGERPHKYLAKYYVNGKPVYLYDWPSLRKRKLRDEIEHSLDQIKKMYKRRESGKGGHKDITSRKDLELILNHTHIAFLSAGRNTEDLETGQKPDSYFLQQNTKLQKVLKEKGFIYTRTMGTYTLPEKSMMVMCHDVSDRDEILQIAKQFRQQSVLFVKEGKSAVIGASGDGEGKVIATGEGWKYIPEAKGDYTEVDIRGRKIKFTMNLVWS